MKNENTVFVIYSLILVHPVYGFGIGIGSLYCTMAEILNDLVEKVEKSKHSPYIGNN